ncbi:hypothetical protein I4U23_006660 [Adineta vaga]|nr:hypothetical protein I4U23_006660 [Adineta vaga]
MTSRSHRTHTTTSPRKKQSRSQSTHQHFESSRKTPSTVEQFSGANDDFLREYYDHLSEVYRRPKLGLQHYQLNEPASSILRQSGIYRHPDLTIGQKLCLLEKCRVYDNEDMKRHRANSCLHLLNKRFTEDLLYKPQYRLSDPRDYISYVNFVRTPRPTARAVNTGYHTPRNPHTSRSRNDNRERFSNVRTSSYLDRKEFSDLSNSTFTY